MYIEFLGISGVGKTEATGYLAEGFMQRGGLARRRTPLRSTRREKVWIAFHAGLFLARMPGLLLLRIRPAYRRATHARATAWRTLVRLLVEAVIVRREVGTHGGNAFINDEGLIKKLSGLMATTSLSTERALAFLQVALPYPAHLVIVEAPRDIAMQRTKARDKKLLPFYESLEEEVLRQLYDDMMTAQSVIAERMLSRAGVRLTRILNTGDLEGLRQRMMTVAENMTPLAKDLSVSIIIPTLNRSDDLRRALQSIVASSRMPTEIIVVEQGDVERTAAVISRSGLAVTLVPLARKSLTHARNVGVTHSSGDLVLFLDDDTEIDPAYIERTARYFALHPNALGIVGRDTLHLQHRKGFRRWVKRLLGVLFFRATLRPPTRVLRSGHNVKWNVGDTEEVVEWLSGCAFSWRRKVFVEGFRFEEGFEKWAFGEDVLFSYQIHKTYPGALRYVPEVQYVHHQTKASRMANMHILRMMVLYRYFFWRNEVRQHSLLNHFCFWWAQVGFVLVSLSQSPTISVAHELVRSYWFVIRNPSVSLAESNTFIFL